MATNIPEPRGGARGGASPELDTAYERPMSNGKITKFP